MKAASRWDPLHLYRQILREISYLPPVCRKYIETRAKLRFRKHRHDPSPEGRLRRANHDFRFLRAANCGDMVRMRKIMMLAFGRIGWRRRQLMACLCCPNQPDSSEQLESQISQTAAAGDWLDKWDTNKVLAFAKSQSQFAIRNSPRPQVNPRKLDPAKAVPPSNTWGRPYTKKVCRSKERKWWASLAHRILPPIPRGEWDLLQKLALGQAGAEWTVPERRTVALRIHVDPGLQVAGTTNWQWKSYAIRAIRVVDRSRSRRRSSMSFGVDVEHGSVYAGPAIGLHHYTARFWRRLYSDIWRMTAIMEKRSDLVEGGWQITWGGVSQRPGQVPSKYADFFEGVDRKGELLRWPIKEQRNSSN